MNTMFIGLIFTMLDFTLTLGSSTIGLLPDFVGYILLYKGMGELADKSDHVGAAKPWIIGLAVYSGILYAMDLLAISVQQEFLLWCLGLLYTFAMFMVIYRIAMIVQDMEQRYFRDLQSGKLKTLFVYWAVLGGVAQVLFWIPLVGVAAVIAASILSICFLVAFHKTKTLYEQSGI